MQSAQQEPIIIIIAEKKGEMGTGIYTYEAKILHGEVLSTTSRVLVAIKGEGVFSIPAQFVKVLKPIKKGETLIVTIKHDTVLNCTRP